MPPMDTARAWFVDSPRAFDDWLIANGDRERETILSIFKKATGKQTVTFGELLDVALCHGWVDVQTKRIDDETYAIRFVPRRPGSNWSATNRANVRRLLDEGRMTAAGKAMLPADFDADERPSDDVASPDRG